MKYNPYLTLGSEGSAVRKGGTGYIESPKDRFMNMIWQTRQTEPDQYEIELCEALSTLFEQGAQQLQEIVQGLNDTIVRPPSNAQWTKENFQSELKRLGRIEIDPM